jgi:membrane protease YdiL (CAAX protease family)
MTKNPLLLFLMTVVGVYVARLWWQDWRAARAGKSLPQALPGATPAPARALVIAAAGSIVLLAVETGGEIRLGLVGEQSTMTALFACYTLVAAIIEEIIFRGYIVMTKRGPVALWGAVLAASGLFALLHPFLWHWDQGLILTFTKKAAFSTAMVFAGSVWFYAVRFAPWNPHRSLLPCFAAHATKNLGVIFIKAAQGFLSGWW